jgi:hypothetical protein
MSTATAELEATAAPKAIEPKVIPLHAWAGRQVFYWRITNAATGEISPLPAMLIAPTFKNALAGTEGWDVNVFRPGQIRGQRNVKFSDKPRAGYWTWGPQGAPKIGK